MNGRKTILGLLTPLVAAASAWLTASVAKYGVHLDQSGVNAALVTGASAAIAVMLKLIHDVETDVDRKLKKKVPPGDDELIAGVLNAMEPQLRLAAITAVQTEIINLTHNIQVTPPLGPASPTAQVTAGTTAAANGPTGPDEAAIGATGPDEAAIGATGPEEEATGAAGAAGAEEEATGAAGAAGAEEEATGAAGAEEAANGEPAVVPQPGGASAASAEPAEHDEPAPASAEPHEPASAERQAVRNGTSMADVASPAARRPGVPPQG